MSLPPGPCPQCLRRLGTARHVAAGRVLSVVVASACAFQPAPASERNHDRALQELGDAVRQRRMELGLTLNSVAQATGLSVPFLSQIETSRAAPSLMSLFGIAQALRTTPERLLAGPVSGEVVAIPKSEGQRYPITDAEQVAFRRQLTGLGEPFSVSEYVIEPDSDLGGYYSSAGRELIHVTSGRLMVDLETEPGQITTYELVTGDTLVYNTSMRHRWEHRGPAFTRFLHVAYDQ